MAAEVSARRDRALARRNPLLAAWKTYGEPFTYFNRPYSEWTADFAENFLARMRAYRVRRRACQRWAWAIPTDDALATIAKYSPIVEIGAGTGYWAHLLRRDFDVDILAYDRTPPHAGHAFGHRRSFVPVLKGGPRKAKQSSDRALFLCWPPYDTPMAAQALALYRGETVIYIGESDGGCNASAAFFDALAKEWHQVEDVALPQWDGIHDRLEVWKRGPQ